MKRTNTKCVAAVALFGLAFAGSALASVTPVNTPWPVNNLGTEVNLNAILGITQADLTGRQVYGSVLETGGSVGGVPASGGDELWSTSIGSRYSSLLIELAGGKNNNTFGIYDTANLNNKLVIFPGPANADLNPGAAVQVNISGSSITVGSSTLNLGGTTFGFFLTTSTATYYSDPTKNIGDGMNDHMVTYNVTDTLFGNPPFPSAGQSGWVMAWEDLQITGGSDADYNDMVVSLTALPIPEPTTMIAAALLLLPFGASTLRPLRKRFIA